jgi:hypothetical protein
MALALARIRYNAVIQTLSTYDILEAQEFAQ